MSDCQLRDVGAFWLCERCKFARGKALRDDSTIRPIHERTQKPKCVKNND